MRLTFSEKLKEIRAQHGMNIRELAKELGINYTLISMLESGKRQPSADVIQKVANYTGLDSKYLEFLAYPIPVEYKRIICESEGAPDFIKGQVDRRRGAIDVMDEFIERLFRNIETRFGASNREYYCRLIADLKDGVYEPKVNAWAEYYEILLGYDLFGPQCSIEMLQTLHQKTMAEPELQNTAYLRLQICFRLGSWLHRLKEYNSAIGYYKKAEEISRTIGNDEGIVNAHLFIGAVYRSEGKYEKAIQVWKKGIKQAEHTPHLRGRILSESGHLYQELGRWNDAISALTEGAEILRLRTINDPEHLAEAHVYLTDVCICRGEFSQAAHWNLQSFATIERIRQKTPHHNMATFLCGRAQCNKAHISFMRHRPNRARRIVEEITHEYRNHPLLSAHQKAVTLKAAFRLMGDIELEDGNLEKARAAYEESLKFTATDDDLEGLLDRLEGWISLCNLYNRGGERAQVETFMQKVDEDLTEDLCSSPRFYQQLATLNRLKGAIAFDKGNVEGGVKFYLAACEYLRKWNPNQFSELSLAIVEQIKYLKGADQQAAKKLSDAIFSWGRKHNLEMYFNDFASAG